MKGPTTSLHTCTSDFAWMLPIAPPTMLLPPLLLLLLLVALEGNAPVPLPLPPLAPLALPPGCHVSTVWK